MRTSAALRAKGDLDGAIAKYRAGLRIDSNLAEPHYNLGNALFEAGDVQGAISEFRAALQIKSNLAEAHYDLACALGNG
jgi:tetratricopeptide (TPR) repeat protein